MVDAVAHVAIARVADVIVPDHVAWLSPSERSRLATLRVDSRRNQFLAGHWLARIVLARAFGGTAADWILEDCKGLPPRVGGRDDLRVSISHSHDWIAVAVATVPVGIDLEQRPRELAGAIESLLLNAGETPGSLDPDALLQRWVAKEAWIKRDAGNALPSLLARLQLHPASPDSADVDVLTHASFHVALAVGSGSPVRWLGDDLPARAASFRVVELRG